MSRLRHLTLAAAIVAFGGTPALAEGQEGLEFEVPPLPPREVKCAIEVKGEKIDPAPVFELMKTDPGQAVACARYLDENLPGWHSAAGADQLVAPFVSYLLGDGTARGLQRHQIFVDLLGHLEQIAPDWRLRDPVEALLPQIILGSVVEDPFVAHFWSTALPEIDQHWWESDAASSVVPELYRRALQEASETADMRNERPRVALKEISWPSHARLQLQTRIFNTPAKRVAAVAAVVVILVLAIVSIRPPKRQ